MPARKETKLNVCQRTEELTSWSNRRRHTRKQPSRSACCPFSSLGGPDTSSWPEPKKMLPKLKLLDSTCDNLNSFVSRCVGVGILPPFDRLLAGCAVLVFWHSVELVCSFRFIKISRHTHMRSNLYLALFKHCFSPFQPAVWWRVTHNCKRY